MKLNRKSSQQHVRTMTKEEYLMSKNILNHTWSKTARPEGPPQQDMLRTTPLPINLFVDEQSKENQKVQHKTHKSIEISLMPLRVNEKLEKKMVNQSNVQLKSKSNQNSDELKRSQSKDKDIKVNQFNEIDKVKQSYESIIKSLKSEVTDASCKNQNYEQQLHDIQEGYEKQIGDYKRELQESVNELNTVNEKYVELEQKLQEALEDKNNLKEKMTELQRKYDEAYISIEKANIQKIEELQKYMNQLLQDKKNMEESLNTKQKMSLFYNKLEQDFNELKQQYIEISQNAGILAKENEVLIKDQMEQKVKINNLQQENLHFDIEIKTQKKRQVEYEEKWTQQQNEILKQKLLLKEKEEQVDCLVLKEQNLINIQTLELKDLNDKFQKQKQQLQIDNRNLQAKVLELEKKLNEIYDQDTIQKENQKLTLHSIDEVEIWKTKYLALEKSFNEELNKLRSEENKKFFYDKEIKENEQTKAIQDIITENELKHLRMKLNESDKRITTQELEIRRLQAQCQEYKNDVEFQKMRYDELEKIHEQQINEIKSLTNKSQRGEQKNDLKDKLVLELQDRIKYLENQVQFKEQDLEKEKLKYKRPFHEEQDQKEQYELQKKNIYEQQQNIVKLQNDKAKLEAELQQYKQLFDNSKLELNNIYELMNARKRDADYAEKQAEELRKEISRLLITINALESELFTVKENYDNVYRDLEEQSQANIIYKSELEKTTIELAHRNRELIERQQEFDVLKIKYEDAVNSSPNNTAHSRVITKVSFSHANESNDAFNNDYYQLENQNQNK